MNAEKVLQLLQAASCFRGDVCTMLPCACAETIAARIEAMEAALREARQYVFAFTGDEDNETQRNSSSLLIEIDAALDKDASK